jgi:hypothetical protein
MVPVSLMAFDGELPQELGNHFALVMLKLPLSIDDPRELLREVSDRMGRIKHSHEPVITFGLQRLISQSPSDVAPLLVNFFADKALGVLTNVPGPRGAITFAGRRVENVLGWAPCSGSQPMTIGLFTYNDTVSVTFGADRTLVPDFEILPGCYVVAMAVFYVEIVGPRPAAGFLDSGTSEGAARIARRRRVEGRWSDQEVSALLGRRGRGDLGQPGGLVEDLGLDGREVLAVGAHVVGAEEEFSAGGQDDPGVRLRAAAVAAVFGGELRGGQCGGHISSLPPGRGGSVWTRRQG